jgi:hypothetical protein
MTMKRWGSGVVLLALLPQAAGAQRASGPSPELAVASAVVASLAPGRIAFDIRSQYASTTRRRWSEQRARAIANVLHADVVSGDSVLVCPDSPRSCTLGAYASLVGMSEPMFTANGRSAKVTVVTHAVTNMPRIPIVDQDVEYTVARDGKTWRVVKQRTTRIS